MLKDNLEYLRKKKNMSQQAVADALSIPRTTYVEYEKGRTEPNISLLIQMAAYYQVSLDNLLTKILAHEDLELMRNKDLRILAMTRNPEGKHEIQLVESKAEAGYLDSFTDPEYISELPVIRFPMAPEGNYRAFEIHGDSMLPLESGSIIICKYVENLNELKNGKTYVVITHKEGVVYKRLESVRTTHQLLAISDNPAFPSYIIPKEDIQELWQYYAHIGFNDVKKTYEYMWEEKINDMQNKINVIHDKII